MLKNFITVLWKANLYALNYGNKLKSFARTHKIMKT